MGEHLERPVAYCTTLSRLDNDLIGFFNRHVEIREKAIHARFFVAENGGNNGRYSAKSQQDILTLMKDLSLYAYCIVYIPLQTFHSI